MWIRFATYLAVNAMVVNTDSMLGMNNNYYLYYDEEAEKFTLLLWDANESFGKLGGSATYDLSLTGHRRSPDGGRSIECRQQHGRPGERVAAGRDKVRRRGKTHSVTRFMASDTFKALYEEKLQVVYEQAFTSGVITETIERCSDLIHSSTKNADWLTSKPMTRQLRVS